MAHPPPASPAEPPQYPERPTTSATPPARKVSRRSAVIGTVIALLSIALLGWWAWRLTQPEPAAGTGAAQGPGGPGGAGRPGGGGPRRGGPATTVGVALAEAADIPVVLDALGTVTSLAVARVQPQVSGVLQELRFKEGETVKRGALLALIDPRPFQMALQQVQGQRQREQAQLEAARVTLQRYRTLLEQDSIARQEVDTQAALVRQLEATVSTSRASESAAQLNLSHTRVTAPISGRAGLRALDVGNVVGPGDSEGIVTITQMTPIDVVFAIPQDHASWLQRNASASMAVRAYDRTRTELLDTGTFASLDNQIDSQTGTVRAKARFKNERLQLFPGQFVNVQLQVRVLRDAVVVPVTAVRHGGSGDHVFVVQADRTVQLRSVTRGQLVGDRVQVTSGLTLGERVVTEGADRLRDGSRVVLPGDRPAGAGPRSPGGPGGAGAPGARPGASAPGAGERLGLGGESRPDTAEGRRVNSALPAFPATGERSPAGSGSAPALPTRPAASAIRPEHMPGAEGEPAPRLPGGGARGMPEGEVSTGAEQRPPRGASAPEGGAPWPRRGTSAPEGGAPRPQRPASAPAS